MAGLRPKGKDAKPPKPPTKDQAVKANTRAPKRGALTSHVRTYTFKPTARPGERAEAVLDPYARPERPPTALETFTATLDAEERPHAERFFRMECGHKNRVVTMFKAAAIGASSVPLWHECPDCKTTIKWWGSETATMQAEWMEHRPNGFDPEAWGQLFTKDRSFWRFIWIEAKEETNER